MAPKKPPETYYKRTLRPLIMKFFCSLFTPIFFGIFPLFFSTQIAAQSYPRLQGRVTDTIGLLAPQDKARIEKKLQELDQKTSAELVVVIVESTKPLPIEDYSIQLAEKWKIGKKAKDNGVILLVAYKDRRMRIEVGYGLEALLTDARSHQIIYKNIIPYFKKRQFSKGIESGVDRLIYVIEAGPKLLEEERLKKEEKAARAREWRAYYRKRRIIERIAVFWAIFLGLAGLIFLLKDKYLWGWVYVPLVFAFPLVLLGIFFSDVFFTFIFMLLFYYLGGLILLGFVKGAEGGSSGSSSSRSSYSGSSYRSSSSYSSSSSSSSSSGSSYSGGGGSFGGGGASGSW